jgi:hypothetical protein
MNAQANKHGKHRAKYWESRGRIATVACNHLDAMDDGLKCRPIHRRLAGIRSWSTSFSPKILQKSANTPIKIEN